MPMMPGGSGDPNPLLDEEEAAALKEVTLFGYPKKAWYASATLDVDRFRSSIRE